MSINNLNTYLNIKDSHLRVVSGNVYAQAMNIGGINVETAHGLQSVSNTGNVTSNTLQFSNAITGFVTTANAQIGRDLVVSGNTTVSTDLTVSANATVADTLTISEHLIASKEATITGNLHVTTIRSDSNVVTEYTGPHDRPLRKYPEVALTQNDESATSGYVASGSSRLSASYEYYEAFDLKTNLTDDNTANTGIFGAWLSSDSRFDSNGDADLTTSNTFPGTSYRGEYCALKLPNAIKLDNFHIFPRGDASSYTNSQAPKDLRVFGSNDGTTWTHMKQFQNLSFTGRTGLRLHVNDSNTYNEYAFFVEKITIVSGGARYCAISGIELYGHEEGSGSLDTTLKTVYNVPATTGTQLEVYYDAKGLADGALSTTSGAIPGLGGTTVNGTAYGDPQVSNEAFVFDGNDYISTTVTGLTGTSVTMSVWVNVNSIDTSRINSIIGLGTYDTGTAGSSTWIAIDSSQRFYTGLVGLNQTVENTSAFTNNWVHLTAIVGTTELSLYQDGLLIGKVNGGTFNLGSNPVLYLGTRSDGSGNPESTRHFTGSIANFRLYSKALNADQVRELYDYQKDYFLGSKSQVTLYKGHLGVGVTEPSGQLELAGDERIQEYPPRAITVLDYHTHIEGHGEFEFYSSQGTLDSTYLNNASWDFTRAFTPRFTTDGGWHGDGVSAPGTYQVVGVYAPAVTSGDGVVQSILKDGSAVLGEWIEMRSPYAINVTRIATAPRTNYGKSRGIGKFVILGSNNGTDWENTGNGAIAPHDISSTTDAGGYGTRTSETIAQVSTNSNGHYYTYHRLVVTHIMGHRDASGHPQYSSGAVEAVNQSYLRFFGTPGPTTLDKGSLTLGRSLDVPRVSRYDVDTETPRPEKLLIDYDTTVNSSLTDISGQGNHGRFISGASYSAPDKAFTFDGGDYSVTVITIPGGNMTWTQSMWFKSKGFSASPNFNVLSFFGSKSTGASHIWNYKADQMWQDHYGKGVYFNYTFEENIWYHAVSVYHGNTSTDANVRSSMYINGVKQTLIASGLTAAAQTIPTTTNYELADYISGTHSSGAGGNSRHNGLISNVKFYSVALEPSEVKKLYNLGRTGRSMVISDTAVGIGKAPEAQLDVRGNISCDGVFRSENPIAFEAYYTDGTQSTTGTYLPNYVRYNYGGCYDQGTGRFYAPINGIYAFHWHAYTNQGDSTSRIFIDVNGADRGQKGNTVQDMGQQLSFSIYLNAGDFLLIKGKGTYPLYFHGHTNHNMYSGHLVIAM